jgi:hypothetical protein
LSAGRRLPTEEGFRTPTTTLSFNNGHVLQQWSSFNNGHVLQQWSRPSTTVMSFNSGHVLQQRSCPSTMVTSFNNGHVLQQWSCPSTTVMSFNSGHVLQQRSSPINNPLLFCHPDRSEAEGRDLRCAIRVPHIYPSTTTCAISKPKDLRFRGPSLEMFPTKHSVVDTLGKTSG